jgi:hypothetical protein
LAGPSDLICGTGSFFLAAELREILLEGSPSVALPDFEIGHNFPLGEKTQAANSQVGGLNDPRESQGV